jgi:hypothetical protein
MMFCIKLVLPELVGALSMQQKGLGKSQRLFGLNLEVVPTLSALSNISKRFVIY